MQGVPVPKNMRKQTGFLLKTVQVEMDAFSWGSLCWDSGRSAGRPPEVSAALLP